jgi:hypothetical protein
VRRRVPCHGGETVRVGRAQQQRFDLDHRVARPVRGLDRDAVRACGGEPYAQGGGCGRMECDTVPGERQQRRAARVTGREPAHG